MAEWALRTLLTSPIVIILTPLFFLVGGDLFLIFSLVWLMLSDVLLAWNELRAFLL